MAERLADVLQIAPEEQAAFLKAALWGLGAAVRRDDRAAARPIVEESVALFREVGDRSGLAGALSMLGGIAQSEGDLARAGALYEESLALDRELDSKSNISIDLMHLGDVAQDQGDEQRAMTLYQESLAQMRHFLELKEFIAQCLLGLAGVAGAVRQGERAARRLSAAETLLNTIGLSVSAWPETRADYDRYVAAARPARRSGLRGGVGDRTRDDAGAGDRRGARRYRPSSSMMRIITGCCG
jgi:tetratricopeptide (TPR) repeat protein